MIASLPWYDLDEIRWATDALWHAIAENLRANGFASVPAELDRITHYEDQWRSPGLLHSQACGYDVLLSHRRSLQLVATPTYRAPGCGNGTYSSFIIVRCESACSSLEELRGARCVINTCTSHSGMNILRSIVAPFHHGGRFFEAVEVSGSHEQSIERVRRGIADVAAIDCVTYELIRRHRPDELSGVRILQTTPAMPAPPFVTSATRDPSEVAQIRRSIQQAIDDRTLDLVRDALLLEAITHVPLAGYGPIAASERRARRAEYFEIPPASVPTVASHG